MTTTISTETRNTSGLSATNIIDSGSIRTNGYIEIRTGTKPSNPEQPATGTLLAVLQLSNPAFKNFSNGVSVANPISTEMIIASGTAGWFRMYNRNNTPVLDGTISRNGQGGDLQLDSIDFAKGGSVTINGTVTVPVYC